MQQQNPFYAESGSSPPNQGLAMTCWANPQKAKTARGNVVDVIGFKRVNGENFLIALDGRRIKAVGSELLGVNLYSGGAS